VTETTPPDRQRGSVLAYAIAFALMGAAGVCLAIAAIGTLESIQLMRAASVLSGLAIVASIVAVVMPRRSR
jgi:hypothetical protein